MMNPNEPSNPAHSRRSIFLIALTTFALTITTLGIAPATWATPAEPIWHSDISSESATRAELASEVKDGDLRLLVVRDESGIPDVDVLNISSATILESSLKSLDKDPTVISLQIDEKLSLIAQPEINAATITSSAIPTPANAYSQWNYTSLRLHELPNDVIGTGIRVAVIDSGVDRNGPELNEPGRVLDGCDWVTSPTNVCRGTGVLDENGHGTHVAGIIAAKKDGVGVSGVSPGVEILPLRVLNARGEGWLSDIAAAIDYAVLNQAKVINLSLGGSIDSAIIRVAIERAVAQGVIVVGAAGNGGTGVPASFPAAYPGVIAVGATTRDNLIATYSHQGNYIDVAAPGSDILSSWPFGSGYARLSGTSMAAPHVAGLAALLLAQNVAPGSVRSQIESNLVSPQYADYSEDRYGKGVIDPYAALGCSSNLLTCTPQANDNAIENTSVAPPVIVPVPTVAPAPAAPAPAPVVVPAPAPVVVVPSIRETLSTKALNKRRIVVNVTAPSGSTTLIQRKVGKKWKTEIKRSSRASQTFKVKRLGTYRVVIVAPNERVTSKSLKARR